MKYSSSDFVLYDTRTASIYTGKPERSIEAAVDDGTLRVFAFANKFKKSNCREKRCLFTKEDLDTWVKFLDLSAEDKEKVPRYSNDAPVTLITRKKAAMITGAAYATIEHYENNKDTFGMVRLHISARESRRQDNGPYYFVDVIDGEECDTLLNMERVTAWANGRKERKHISKEQLVTEDTRGEPAGVSVLYSELKRTEEAKAEMCNKIRKAIETCLMGLNAAVPDSYLDTYSRRVISFTATIYEETRAAGFSLPRAERKEVDEEAVV